MTLSRQILKVVPDALEVLQFASGLASSLGHHDEACTYFGRLLGQDPENAALYNSLGVELAALGRFDEAKTAYLQAIARTPDFAAAFGNLGLLYFSHGHFHAARDACERAVGIDPAYAKAHNILGNALHALGQKEEAISAYRRALDIDPEMADVHTNLGNAMKLSRRYREALAAYRQALAIDSDYASAHYNLGNLQQDLGQFEDSRISLRRSLEIQESAGAAVRLALLCPIIPASTDQIQTVRDEVVAALDTLEDRGTQLVDPYAETRFTNFLFAYHGVDDRPLQERIAQFYLRACPDLGWTAPHCTAKPRGRSGDRIRLGVASAFFTGHTIAKLFEGLITSLSWDRFEVVLFQAPGKIDETGETYGGQVDKVVSLTACNIPEAREKIAAEELDILFYPDIGMTSLTFFTAFARLAPVQCCSWGHPVTTGIPNMDYFLSSRWIEEPGGEQYYSEHLVKLDHFPMCYRRLPAPSATQDRAALGLPGEGALYVCPQTLFKLHPDFDHTLGALLQRDPEGWVILIEDGFDGHWQERLMGRFRQAFPDQVDRVCFIERLPTERFVDLLAVADALLDVPQFSGGNSSLEALSLGTPIVTWPMPFMKARVTAGFYRAMGVTDLIADSLESYVDIAYRLAHDQEWREVMCGRILESNDVLYENDGAVRDFERFFQSAVEKALRD